MKEQLCEAFCAQLHVEPVLRGWAVQTPYRLPDGDPVTFFIIRAGADTAHLEDDGSTIAFLEGSGVSLDRKGARWSAFSELLNQHEARFDDEEGVIRTGQFELPDVGAAAVKFTALMLRVHDLALLNTERVRQSWKDDALRDLHARFDTLGRVEEDTIVSPKVSAIAADAVIRVPNNPPLVVIMGTTNAKGLQALVLKMELEKYQNEDIPVVLLLERAKDNPLSEGTYALAQSRLNGVHTYRGAEADAMSAVSRHLGSATLQ